MPVDLITRAVHGRFPNVSRHLVWLKSVGVLEHRMGRLYAIPDRFLVPGERVVDFGPIVLRFDRGD